jgi:hypothetical protein
MEMIEVIDVEDSDEEEPGGISGETRKNQKNEEQGRQGNNGGDIEEIITPIQSLQNCVMVLSDSEESGEEQPTSNGSQQQHYAPVVNKLYVYIIYFREHFP